MNGHTACPAGSLLDQAYFHRLLAQMDKSAACRLLTTFSEETRRRLTLLSWLLSQQDWFQASLQAHALKSTAASLGALGLQRYATKLELACLAQSASCAWGYSRLLEPLAGRTLRRLSALVPQRAPA